MNQRTIELYKFIKENSGYIVGQRAQCALKSAKRLDIALDLDFKIHWEPEEYIELGNLGDYESEETFRQWLDSGKLEVWTLTVESEEHSESLGYITVRTDLEDIEDYKRMFELELIEELYLSTIKPD